MLLVLKRNEIEMKKEPLNSKNIETIAKQIKEDGKYCYYVLYYMIAYRGYTLSALIDIRMSEIVVEEKRIRYVPRQLSKLYPFLFPEEITNELRELINGRSNENDYLFQTPTGRPVLIPNFVAYLKELGNKYGIENLTCSNLKGRIADNNTERKKAVEVDSTQSLNGQEYVNEIYKKIATSNVESNKLLVEVLNMDDENRKLLQLGRILEAYDRLLKYLKNND